MRKLVLLFLGFALAWLAIREIASAEDLAPFIVRDGLALALVAAILFAWGTQAPGVCASTIYNWPNIGQALFGAGVMTGLVGALLHTASIPYASLVIAIGAVILLLGAWWPGVPLRYAQPPVRWERDVQGRFVRKPGNEAPFDTESSAVRWHTAAVIAVLVGGAIARLLWLGALPVACVGGECLAALALVNGQRLGAPLFALATQALYALSADALWSLRFSSACIGVLTLLFFYLAVRRMASPAGAFLGLLLLSFLPWHLWASRSGAPWIEAPLWMSILLWAGVAAAHGGDRRYWATGAVALGLLMAAIPFLLTTWLLWLIALAGLAFAGRRTTRLRDLSIVLAAGAPFCLIALAVASPPEPNLYTTNLPVRLFATLSSLLVGAEKSAPLVALLAPPAVAALVVSGIGALVRYGRTGLFVYFGLAAGGLGLALWQAPAQDPTNDALVLLAPLMMGATAALDQLVRQVQRAWQPAIRPAVVIAAAGALLTLILLGSVAGLWRQVEQTAATAQNAVALAAAQQMAALWSSADGSDALVFAPQAIWDDPLVQLSAATAIQTGRARPFSLAHDLPVVGQTPQQMLYLFPTQEIALWQLAQAVYPMGESATIQGERGEPLLYLLRVPGDALAGAQRLEQTLFTADGVIGVDGDAAPAESLHFAWGASPPASQPFGARWQGSLKVPAAGDYRFVVESPPGALFSLLLDHRLILDTSAGVSDQVVALPQGWQNVDMRYRSGDAPGDLRVQWQPPGGDLEPIPTTMFFNPSLPNMGLRGSYFAGNAWSGPPLTQRKDWALRPDESLPRPYSVHWQGKFAAPRAGETLLGVVTDGAVRVSVDGERLIDFRADPAAGELTAEGVITLEQGWHAVDILYASDGDAPDFKLYWQSPGAGPAPLPLEMFAPVTADLAALDLPLPAPPPLVDERLGDDSFALSASVDLWQPRRRIPPVDLPQLPLEHLWTVGGCGSGKGEFSAPRGLAFDPARALLHVADAGNRRVVGLGLDGQSFQFHPVEGLAEPVDVALSPDGALLVLDAALPAIVRFDPAAGVAAPIAAPGDLYRPRGLAVDGLGQIYVADTGGARVVVLEPGGRVLAEFGGPSSTLGQGQPVDVLATGRSIWAIAAEHGRLWQLDTLGSLTAVQPTDTIVGPHLAGLPAGRFLLSDPARNRIVLMDANGRPLAHFDDGGLLQQPTGVSTLVDGEQVFVAAADARRCTVSVWRMHLADLPQGKNVPNTN